MGGGLPGIPPPDRLVEGPHPKEARLHKWEARKDAGVVSAWIEAGSRPGELVVDPFMGSGTAPLAAARRGRRAVGVDLSPLAVRIARVIAAPPRPAHVRDALGRIEARLRGPSARALQLPSGRRTLASLYAARCPSCGGAAELAHAVWAVRIACACGAVTGAADLLPAEGARGRAGGKRCPSCGRPPLRGGDAYRGEELHRCFVRCPEDGLVEAAPTDADRALAASLEAERRDADVWTPSGVALRYPDGTPLAQLRHGLRSRPVLDELWTGRSFLATGLLAEAVDEEGGAAAEALRMSLSAIVKATSRMPTMNTGGWRNKGTGLSSHLLGIFPLHLEQNAWEELHRHATTRLLPAIEAASSAPRIALCDEPDAPGSIALWQGDAAARLAALPEASTGLVFADPPYGDAVQYAELALPHLAWLLRPLAGEALAREASRLLGEARAAEVVENPAQGKGRAAFASRLSAVLGQVRRILVPGRALVLTFNSPEDALVDTVRAVAEGVGLVAGPVLHQAAFKESHKGAWHARSARGTLYLRFVRPA